MATPAQKRVAAAVARHNPYSAMMDEGMGHLRSMRQAIEHAVAQQRQVSALRRAADVTFVGADSDTSLTFVPAGTYAVIRVPTNMSWKCMRAAVSSAANDILYMYRGAPEPQNIVERMTCGADGFYVDSFSNDLYMAAASTIIVQSSLAAQFHVNLEIERMVPYMQPVSAAELHDELVQTPHDNYGADRDYPSRDIVEPEVERHIEQIDAPAEVEPKEADPPRQLLPDPSAHLPGAHV